MTGQDPIIEVENLSKNYNGFTAVNEVNFHIERGEVFGFLGPNGAGKTTTINMLTGLARISAGKVKIMGEDYTSHLKKAQKLMGIVPDESNLYDELSGWENLCFCGALYGMEKAQREKEASRLLHDFGLTEAASRSFQAYSKGMKRKLTIAAGIIHQPEILFLDEPTTGIDVASARQIRNLITELNQRGTTIFLTTHYIEEAERLCSRLAFIVEGQIIRESPLEELMKEAQRENVVHFSLEGNFYKLEEEFQAYFPDYRYEPQNDGRTINIHSSVSFNLLPFVQFFEERGIPVYEAKILRPSLEEVFVSVTGIELPKAEQQQQQS